MLEELIGDLNSRLLGSVMIGAMLGALVAHGIIGPQPSFSLAAIGEPSWYSYLLVPVVAAAGTLVGVAFQKSALGLRARQRKWTAVPAWLRPAIGGLICWALGVFVFFQTGKLGVFGLGYDDLSEALTGKLIWQTAALAAGGEIRGHRRLLRHGRMWRHFFAHAVFRRDDWIGHCGHGPADFRVYPRKAWPC